MTPKQAKIILDDDCIDSLIEACDPNNGEDYADLKPLHEALKALVKHLIKMSARKS